MKALCLFLFSFFSLHLFGQTVQRPLSYNSSIKKLQHIQLQQSAVEICDNNLDDDGNGLTDNKDYTCYFKDFKTTACANSSIAWFCSSMGFLYWIDLTTRQEHQVGMLSTYLLDISWASDGKLYGTGGYPNGIWEVDPLTAVCTFKGRLPGGYEAWNALSADGAGNLYVTARDASALSYVIRVNINTWDYCFIADLRSANVYPAGDLTFYNGDLYLACELNTIARINIQDRSVKSLQLNNGSSEGITGYFGFINMGDGSFYGSNSDKIYRIDPATMTVDGNAVFTASSFNVRIDGMASYAEICGAPKCVDRIKIKSPVPPYICKTRGVELEVDRSCNASVGTSVWTTPSGEVIENEMITAFDPGKYYMKYENTTGECRGIDSFTLKWWEPDLYIPIGNDTTICLGKTLILSTPKEFTAISYLWQDGSTNPTFKVTQSGTYTLQVKDFCGVLYKGSVKVRVESTASLNLGSDQEICAGDSVRLNAPTGFISYHWSNNYHLSSQVGQSVIVAPLVDTAYFIKAELSNGCFAADTVRVKIKNSDPITLGNDTSLCSGSSMYLNAGNGFKEYSWSTGEETPQIQVTTIGTFSVMATAFNGCKSYDTLRITTLYDSPEVNLPEDSIFCSATSYVLDAGALYHSYHWSNGENQRMITVTSPGTYSVMVEDVNGCKGSDFVNILRLGPVPSRFLPSDTVQCTNTNTTIHLKPAGSFSKYLWNTGSTQSTINISEPGVYSLQVWDEFGCEGKNFVSVSLKDCTEGIYVPNAFTPNADGVNDTFNPRITGIVTDYQFAIYNRWGEVIFSSVEISEGWDGRLKGKSLENNVFVWTLRCKINGKPQVQRGTVTLIR